MPVNAPADNAPTSQNFCPIAVLLSNPVLSLLLLNNQAAQSTIHWPQPDDAHNDLLLAGAWYIQVWGTRLPVGGAIVVHNGQGHAIPPEDAEEGNHAQGRLRSRRDPACQPVREQSRSALLIGAMCLLHTQHLLTDSLTTIHSAVTTRIVPSQYQQDSP